MQNAVLAEEIAKSTKAVPKTVLKSNMAEYGNFVSASERVKDLEPVEPTSPAPSTVKSGLLAAAMKLRPENTTSPHAASSAPAAPAQSQPAPVTAQRPLPQQRPKPPSVKKEAPPAPSSASFASPALSPKPLAGEKATIPLANETPAAVQESAEKSAVPQEAVASPSMPPQETALETETISVSLDAFTNDEASSADDIKNQLQMDKIALEMEKRELAKLKQKQKEEEQLKKQKEKAAKIRMPIGAKLIIIISLIVVIALGSVSYFVSYFTTQDVRTSAEENNLVINSRTTTACENSINGAISAVGMFLDLLKTSGQDESQLRYMEALFFNRNQEIAAVYLPGSGRIFESQAFLASHEIEEETVRSYMAQEDESAERAKNGSVELLNASPFFATPLLALFIPHQLSDEDAVVALLYSTEELGNSFASGTINQSFFVNNDGDVLVHSDLGAMLGGINESENPIVAAMQQSSITSVTNNGQMTFKGSDGEEYIGAFRRLGIGNGGIVTTVKTSVVLEGVRRTTWRNVYITIAILSLTIMIIYFFSKSLSKPLKALTAVANEINKGNFNTELFNNLTTKNKDEIGILTKSTKNEREILNMFTKLTNKGVTKAIITKRIDFEPHLKDITIFFSDIRGFTAISDGFKNRFGEKSAAEIINFLNDYMSRMVTCITLTGGIVDKFEGDAIMACWGALRNDGLDWEDRGANSVTHALKKDAHDKYVKEDALSAVKTCMGMRYSLMKYNKDAEAFTKAHADDPKAQYKPYIRIGAGLNSGRATVGFMGSFDKMEFTSIGDSVNLASRTEASNKLCGTDLLITEDTYTLLKHDYIRCEENNFTIQDDFLLDEIIVEQIPVAFEVKGKGMQHFYGVVNMPHFDIKEFFLQADESFELDADCAKAAGELGPKTLKQMRVLLGIPEPDFSQVDMNAQENKIKVASA